MHALGEVDPQSIEVDRPLDRVHARHVQELSGALEVVERRASSEVMRPPATDIFSSGSFEDEGDVHRRPELGDLPALDGRVLLDDLDARDAAQRPVRSLEGVADGVLPAVRDAR